MSEKKEGYKGFHNTATERYWQRKFPLTVWRAEVMECRTQAGYKEWLVGKMNQCTGK